MCECCKKNTIPQVNAHLHTPYSFSAFETLTEALDRAVNEGVNVVGINDFYSTKGFEEWSSECKKRRLYPLFNIEFISLQKEDQAAGIRVNDPNNPGRTYLSGKGLACPATLPEPYASQLAGVSQESNAQVRTMCGKLNELLSGLSPCVALDLEQIERTLTQGSLRERHLAKALRLKVEEVLKKDEAAIKALYKGIFGGKELKSEVADFAGVENEIRGNLLKAKGAAFVAEDPKAFLPMEDVCEIILAAKGIPTYPFLGDDAKGGFTDFEADLEKAARTLRERGFYSVEFITTRNSVQELERYASYLHDAGFVVTFGSEHNTPAMEPIKLFARGGVELTERLKEIGYEGACVVAAHQELVKRGGPGYVDAQGVGNVAKRADFIQMGDAIIRGAIAH